MALVLDTRFLLAHTFPPSLEDKVMVERFTARLLEYKIIIPSVVVVEYTKIAGRRIGRAAAETRLNLWKNAGAEIVCLSQELAYEAGKLALKYPEVPLVDIIIAAIAFHYRARIVSDDPHYSTLGARILWYKR